MITTARALTAITLALLVGIVIGWLGAGDHKAAAAGAADTKQPLYWVAPMDPNYRRDQPGKSPMGMDLIPVYDAPNDAAGTVTISPQVENNLGVRSAVVTLAPLTQQVAAVGFVAVDADRIHHIHSRVEGWIGALAVTSSGDRVREGQLLFELYAPELVNAQEELLAAQRIGSRTLKHAAREKLLAYGVSEKQIKALSRRKAALQYLPFQADFSGYIGELNVRHGMFVSPRKEMLSIYTLDSVWVIAEIFERQVGWVEPGQRVSLRSQSYPGRSWKGKVDYIYPVLDEATRSVRVRIDIPNRDAALRPNMLVSLSISATTAADVLTVPRESVIRTASMNRVVKSLGDGRYQAAVVKTGREAGGRTEILAGLAVGDSVVTSAQFLLDSESNIAADLTRLSQADARPQAPQQHKTHKPAHINSAEQAP